MTRKESLKNQTIVADLLNELTYLPLAIAQAAAYLNITKMSLQDYLSLLKNIQQNKISLLSRELDDGTRYKDSECHCRDMASIF